MDEKLADVVVSGLGAFYGATSYTEHRKFGRIQRIAAKKPPSISPTGEGRENFPRLSAPYNQLGRSTREWLRSLPINAFASTSTEIEER